MFLSTQSCRNSDRPAYQKMEEKIADAEALGNAGKWIGIIERLGILTLVLNHQYEAIGLLIAAKRPAAIQ